MFTPDTVKRFVYYIVFSSKRVHVVNTKMYCVLTTGERPGSGCLDVKG